MALRPSMVWLWTLTLSTSLAYGDAPQPSATQNAVPAEKPAAAQNDPVPLEKEGSDAVITSQFLHDTLQIEDVPSNINKDTTIFLYGDPKPKKRDDSGG